jgi:glycerol-3-phosphate cytidylyltransferase
MTAVLTMGTFDLPHAGHVALLRQCRKLAAHDGLVVVAVNRDDFVAKFKARPPVMTYDERAAVIAAIRYVDAVVENTGASQAGLIESIAPDWLAVGSDWARRDYMAQLDITPDWLAERGIGLAYLEHEQSTAVSTTKLRQRQAAS